jgi:hypothetical protein
MKLPLARRMSRLAWPLAGLVKATAELLAWLREMIAYIRQSSVTPFVEDQNFFKVISA